MNKSCQAKPRLGTARRQFLQGLGATALGLSTANAGTESAPRVAIIGAGMAGLAAARELTRRKVPFVVLEARDRIGGRAFTDTKSLSVLFDQGCASLHTARFNPLASIAAALGFELSHEPAEPQIYFDRDNLGIQGQKSFDAASAEIARAIGAAGARAEDVPAISVTNLRSIWDRLAAFAIGPEQVGAELHQLSTLDWYSQLNTGGGRDGLIRDGLGTMVAAFGAHVPVSLSTRVSAIDWAGQTVRISTNAGSVEAECCLVTVPVGVLRAGSISFTPALPANKLAALNAIEIGVVNRIALAFRANTLPPEKNYWFYQLRKDGSIADVLVRPFGRDISIHVVGGKFAREMELLNDADQTALALASMTDIFGNDVAAGWSGGAVTRWLKDANSLGSHSVTIPGQAHQRAELAKPVGDRIYFAGEACAASWASSLAGAYLSGKEAARLVAEQLR